MILAFKLVLTPSVIVASTHAGRRFGRAASGWFVGLPLTSGPITAFFAVQHGRAFAARAAVGSLGGAIAEVSFCVAYAAGARRGSWRTSLAAGTAAFAVTAAVLRTLDLTSAPHDVLPGAAASVAALCVGLWLLPAAATRDAIEPPPPRWDLPGRAVAATALLLSLTALATTLGPALAGLLAVYPLYSAVLAGFAHVHAGPRAATQVLRGLLVGLFSFVCFYTVLPLLLPRMATAPAFALAFGACATVQVSSLVPLLRAHAFTEGSAGSAPR